MVPRLTAIILASIALASCRGVLIEDVDFGWPVESVLTVGAGNRVDDPRHGLAFSVAALAHQEFGDSNALRHGTIRLLRSSKGFYYVTAPGFRTVYVLESAPGTLRIVDALAVSDTPLLDPALNHRPPHVIVLDSDARVAILAGDGTVEKDSR